MQKPINSDEFVSQAYVSRLDKQSHVEWNYRDAEGVLHAGVAKDEAEAFAAAAVFGFTGDPVVAQELEDNRVAYRDEQRRTALEDITRATKWAIEKGAVRSDLQAALQAGGASVALLQIAEGASKPQHQQIVAIKTKVDRNGNSQHGYLVEAPIYAPLPNGDTGRFFIESPGDNIRDLFDRVPDAQWPAFELVISRGDYRWYKQTLPEAPRVATRADQINLRAD